MLFGRLGGLELAVEVLGRRGGTALDPFIAEAFCALWSRVAYGDCLHELHRDQHGFHPKEARRILIAGSPSQLTKTSSALPIF